MKQFVSFILKILTSQHPPTATSSLTVGLWEEAGAPGGGGQTRVTGSDSSSAASDPPPSCPLLRPSAGLPPSNTAAPAPSMDLYLQQRRRGSCAVTLSGGGRTRVVKLLRVSSSLMSYSGITLRSFCLSSSSLTSSRRIRRSPDLLNNEVRELQTRALSLGAVISR